MYLNNRIVIIGPGLLPIPPKGWGAVEKLIHLQSLELTRLGFNVTVINESDPKEIASRLRGTSPSIVYCQYDDHAWILDKLENVFTLATPHFGYIDIAPFRAEYASRLTSFANGRFSIFCLSERGFEMFNRLGVESSRLSVVPNGLDLSAIRFSRTPEFPDRAICIGKIDERKKQAELQEISRKTGLRVDFVGPRSNNTSFDYEDKSYLGEWTSEEVSNRLTDYGALVLLSSGEAHSLVVIEAMAAGLPVVLSLEAAANLKAAPWLHVLPKSEINNPSKVEFTIRYARRNAPSQRADIRLYALKHFSIENWGKRFKLEIQQSMIRKISRELDQSEFTTLIHIIATGSYFDLFVPRLISSIFEKFLQGHKKLVAIYTDRVLTPTYIKKNMVLLIPTEKREWPFSTADRWELIESSSNWIPNSISSEFYLDADMEIVDEVKDDIIGRHLVAVLHPGYFDKPSIAAPFERRPESSAFVPRSDERKYVQGCFFGGHRYLFRQLVASCRESTEIDFEKRIMAIWHDESHLNKNLPLEQTRYLSPSFAYPEGWTLSFKPIIMHRHKDNKSLQV